MRMLILAMLLTIAPCTRALAIDVPESVLAAEQQRIAAIAKASACTISVFSPGGGGGGSGVLISPDGYAVTNFHVAKPSGNFMKCSLPDGNLYDAVIVGLDPTGDVALIKLVGRTDFPVATVADSDQVQAGDWCFAIGNPFLLATDFQPTVTYGIISGVQRYQYPAGTLLEYTDCLQTDAAINPGNSGGPLFNAAGDLIGINGRGSFEKRGRVNVGVGYAISINQVMHFLGDLKSGRIVDHATLGASVATDDSGRVTVTNILDSSDAYRRGLRYGDEIIALGGRAIGTANALKNVLGIYPKGWRIPLSYRRDGQRFDTYVRLAGVHSREELWELVQGPTPAEDDPQHPDGKKPQGPKLPKIPIPQLPKQDAAPEAVAKLFQEKPGYANYYFNALERERVWNALLTHTNCLGRTGTWELRGALADGGEFALQLRDDGVTAKWPNAGYSFDTEHDFDAQLAPEHSGGLLVALHVWRRMLVRGPAQFGDVFYHGQAPLPEHPGLFDVLVGTHQVVETRFLFAESDGQLVALEMFPDVQVDPCELYFSDFRAVDGQALPHVIEVRHGERVFATLKLEQITLPAATPEDASEEDAP